MEAGPLVPAAAFHFVAQAPWLDLVNTRPIVQGERRELLATPDDLAAWLVESATVDATSARRARTAWRGAAGARALAEVLGVRDALDALAAAAREGAETPERALARVNAFLAAHPAPMRISRDKDGLRSAPVVDPDDPLSAVSIVLASLTDTPFPRVRRCEGPTCVLYFHDTSRNGARRWCSMATCGNREKAAAHYARTRGSRDQP